MALQEDRQDVLVHILAQIKLPINVSFRVWEEDDFPAIQRLSSTEGWPTPEKRPAEAFAGWKASWPVFVALEDEQVIGFVRALTDGAITLYITELLVAPTHRGRGIGRLLLDSCHLLYPCTRIELMSVESAQRFYLTHGFRSIGLGVRKSYA